jgi:hypothetical protein
MRVSIVRASGTLLRAGRASAPSALLRIGPSSLASTPRFAPAWNVARRALCSGGDMEVPIPEVRARDQPDAPRRPVPRV